MSAPKAEFDEYAKGDYSAGMEDGFKRLMGESARVFLEHKAAWLMAHLAKAGLNEKDKSLLDLGCGTGTFLQVLQEQGFVGKMDGCDVSSAMMEESSRLVFVDERPDFHLLTLGEALPFADDSFDFVSVLCVCHHVELIDRPHFFQEIIRVLKPGGNVFIFEHNPWNPATLWIVSRCPIDVNAHLLTSSALEALLSSAAFEGLKTKFILFFPPRLKALWPFEKFLSWIPFGGQYVTSAQKPEPSVPAGS